MTIIVLMTEAPMTDDYLLFTCYVALTDCAARNKERSHTISGNYPSVHSGECVLGREVWGPEYPEEIHA